MNTARRLIAYESRAARWRCGGSCATSVEECRILLIHLQESCVSSVASTWGEGEADTTHLLCVGGVDALVQLAREDGLEERGRDRDPADLADTTEELAEPGPDGHRVLCRTLLVSPWITHDAYSLLTWQMGEQRDCYRSERGA